MQSHPEAMHVEQWQRQHEHVVGRPAPGQLQRSHRRQQVGMAQHSALGPPRRARRVSDEGRLIGPTLDSLRLNVETCRLRADARESRGVEVSDLHGGICGGDPLMPFALIADAFDKRCCRTAVGHHAAHLVAPVGAVHRHHHNADAQQRRMSGDHPGRTRPTREHPVARHHAGRDQALSHISGARLQPRAAHPAVVRIPHHSALRIGRPVAQPDRRQRAADSQIDLGSTDARRQMPGPMRLLPIGHLGLLPRRSGTGAWLAGSSAGPTPTEPPGSSEHGAPPTGFEPVLPP